MESLLKEALKCLCGENRWTYAIFWKIGCNNPTLLVWEDYHYESRNSTSSDTADLLLKGWEGMWNYHNNQIPHVGGQTEDKVGSLLNKMMINNHVHVVGQGLVGRAAFTDFHIWILQENILRDQFPSEIWAEMHHQISAGMQTVAAIPVLPHGVVQLGSALTIMENIGFINDVKSLFAQLGTSPTGLSTDYYTKKDLDQSLATPPLFGIPISADSSRNSYSQTAKFTPFISTSNSQEMSTSQPLVFANKHPSSFIPQNDVYVQRNAPARASNLSSITSKSATDPYHLNSHPVINPHLPLSGQLGTRTVGAQVILPSPDARLNQRKSLYESTSKSNASVLSDSSFNSLTFIEQPIASSVGLQELVSGSLPASNNIHTSQLRSCGDKIPNSVNDPVIVTLLSGNQPPNTRNDLQMASSLPYTTTSSLTPCVDESMHTTSSKGVVQVSNERSLSNNNYALPGVFHPSRPYVSDNLTNTKITKGKQAMENDVFQSLDMPVHQPDDRIPRSGLVTDSLHEFPVSNSGDAKKNEFSQSVISEHSCMQLPSGDDLFDILGLDFKSDQLYGSWNNFLIHEEDVKMENGSINAATCVTQTEAANESISESGIFNGVGSDNLLDAMVSRLQSSAKQNSDYDISCWTAKMSNSSVVTDPLLNGRINVSDQKQVQSFGFPSPLAKSQITGSSSLQTGCSFDKTVESSQLNSMYGSQISSLCEDVQTMKRESSISTAHSKRPDDTGKVNRKRLRPGENPRPRPKDRQMIQDRVKELREIIPNGAKCSIDALLERAVKHLLFLQSVMKHADKLKNTGESKIIDKDGRFLLEDNFNAGSMWAFEVGSHKMASPIIVEDLNTPRLMRVEMLCEDQGFFLEIADIIRGLGLTILKGVMEARNDKIWVRFIVEANRDVTRMEIFLSLVHMLEQATKSNASSSKVSEGSNMIAHNTFQPTSIPVTGCGL